LNSFSDEESSKPKILDMVCAMKSFENINKEVLKNGQEGDACEVGFQHDKQTLPMQP
jgi:hypothetical protein